MYKIKLNGEVIEELFLEGVSPSIPVEAIPISDEDGKTIAAAVCHDLFLYRNGKLEPNKEKEDKVLAAKDKTDKKVKAEEDIKAALCRLILGQPMTSADIQAATDFLGG